MSEIYGFDAFSPKEIADRIEQIGVSKTRLPLRSVFMLGLLAGGFIALGAMFYTIIASDPEISFGVKRLLGGLVFSLGLVMVVVAGAELFTGNNLLVMAWADGKIKWHEVLRNWFYVFIANFIGSIFVAALVVLSRHPELNDHAIAHQYLKIAEAKCSIAPMQAFYSGILCNVLVCLAIWMAQAGRSVMDKFIVVVFPIAAFVAAGFEHCIANMYFISIGIFLNSSCETMEASNAISWTGFLQNLVPVVAGNLVGGSVLVAFVYHIIYKRGNSGST